MTSSGISVIGLGKLGLPLAACLASSGFRVFGIDRDEATTALVDTGKAPFHEAGLAMEVAYRKHGVPEKLFSTVDELNTARVIAMTDRIISLARKISARPQVLLVGLAFKTGTALTTGSPAMDIAASLKTVGIDTGGWDRHVKQADLGQKLCLTMFSSLHGAFEAADVVVLLHHDKSISREVERYSPASKKVLLDCWRNIDPAKIHRNFILHRLGIA